MTEKSTIFLLKNDLRLVDNHGLYLALNDKNVIVLYVLSNEQKLARNYSLVMDSLCEIDAELRKHGGQLYFYEGSLKDALSKLANLQSYDKVITNRSYLPADKQIQKKLTTFFPSIDFVEVKDSVVFEKDEIKNLQGNYYKVFSAYKKSWLTKLNESKNKNYKIIFKNLSQKTSKDFSLPKYSPSTSYKGGRIEALKKLKSFQSKINSYDKDRNEIFINASSNLSAHIAIGNLSIRELVSVALANDSVGAHTWLSQLIWREFYYMILDYNPEVLNNSYDPKFKSIKWVGKKTHFNKWKEGKTGYPIIDSAMRCLNETGFMHNRLRMVVASFLTKTLLIDWKLGQDYFAEKLLDHDPALNNGGWQWSAGTGADAQPYFRIFNPYNQSLKFDSEGLFIKKWIPELKDLNAKEIHNPKLSKAYPAPIVDYKAQKFLCLKMYNEAKN